MSILPDRLRALLEDHVDTTSPDRDRFIDLLRVTASAVVVLWHWTLSITHWGGGALVMGNPVDVVPGAPLATWVLQIMPLFFVIGGFVNITVWRSVQRNGGGLREFYGSRIRRLLLPTAVFAAVWSVLDLALFAIRAEPRSVLDWGTILFTPLWFLGAYVGVILLVPITARLHRSGGVLTVTVMGAGVALTDLGRFQLGIEELGSVNSALVWVFVHQLGYLYRDGTLARIGVRGQAAMGLTALFAMVALTRLPVYATSLVATRDVGFSHMWPTTAVIAVAALLQTALAMLLRPLLQPSLQRDRVWRAIAAIDAVLLTVFLWHMTAKVAAIGVYQALGFELLAEPTAAWWLQRPLWLLGPGVLLVGLVALFGPFELRMHLDRRSPGHAVNGSRRPSRRKRAAVRPSRPNRRTHR